MGEICYAPMAMVTDFDCWHQEETEVTVETVVQNLKRNISIAKKIIHSLVSEVPQKRKCICSTALKNAIMTAPGAIPKDTREQLDYR